MKIRQRGNSWQLDFVQDGKRRQLSFRKKIDAEREMHKLQTAGTSTALTTTERQSFSRARDDLAAVGATIEEAVAFFLSHQSLCTRPMTFAEMAESCLEQKWEEGKRPRYLAQLKCSAASLARWLDPRIMAHEVTADMIREWLGSQAWAQKTKNVYLGDLRTIFEWGKEQGAVSRNPCAEIRRAKLDDAEIEALSVSECARLLLRSQHSARVGMFRGEDFHDLLPYVALALFTGIRPEELRRLTWAEIDLEEGTVIVLGRAAKTRQRRVVDISENGLEWLRAWTGERSGPVCPRNFRRKWERLRRACGFAVRMAGEIEAPAHLRPWPHDALRHTFATMHYAQHRNELLLQSLMGHTSSAMIFQHYRALTTRRAAGQFWRLRPRASGDRSGSRGTS